MPYLDKKKGNAHYRSYYARHPEKRHEVRLKYEYGLTAEDYNNLLEKQNKVCAICKKSCSVKDKLSVDHCHKTGKIRGLLCHKCNVGLGCFNDDFDLLLIAVQYMEENL